MQGLAYVLADKDYQAFVESMLKRCAPLKSYDIGSFYETSNFRLDLATHFFVFLSLGRHGTVHSEYFLFF